MGVDVVRSTPTENIYPKSYLTINIDTILFIFHGWQSGEKSALKTSNSLKLKFSSIRKVILNS